MRRNDLSQALGYLDSLMGSGSQPGLKRIKKLLAHLGGPQHAVPAVIVAGTNGKGSTSATLASILTESGYRCAFYSSPHLVDIRERWLIDGKAVDDNALVSAVRLLREASLRTGIAPTHFEALTVLAFIMFAAAECDITVLEVGMGGRLDATNVVRPLLSLITPIAVDHVEYLGRTLRKIAGEKAGVIHASGSALTSNTDPLILSVLQKRCRRFGKRLHVLSRESSVSAVKESAVELRFSLSTKRGARYTVKTPLAGNHQIQNVSLAVLAAESLRVQFPRIDRQTIERGVRRTRWRGRLERFKVKGRDVFVDGGHNAHAAAVIASFVRRHIRSPRALVFGIMRDKEPERVASILFPLFDQHVLTQPDPERGMDPDELRSLAASQNTKAAVIKDPEAAVEFALRKTKGPLVVCGSLYLAGSATRVLDRKRQPAQTRVARTEKTTAIPVSRRRRPK